MPFCSKCGKEPRSAGDKFCLHCGETLKPAGIPGQAGNGNEEDRGPKSNKPKLLIVLGAVALVAAAAAVYFFIFSQTPRNALFAAEQTTSRAAGEKWAVFFDNYTELQEQTQVKPNSKTYQIALKLPDTAFVDDEELEAIQLILDNSALRLTFDSDFKEQKNLIIFALEIMGAELLDIQLYQSADQTGFQVPVLSERYFYFDNDQFGQVMRRIDPFYYGMEELPMFFGSNFANGEHEKILKRYLDYLHKSIKNQYIDQQSGVEYISPEGTVQVDRLTISMTSEEARELFGGLLETIREDDWLADLIVDYVIGFDPDLTASDRALMKAEFNFIIQMVLRELRGISFPDGFEMTLLLDDRGRIVDRDIFFTLSWPDIFYEPVAICYQSSNWWKKQGGEEGAWLFEVYPRNLYSERFAIGGEWVYETGSDIDRIQYEAYMNIFDSAPNVTLDFDLTRRKIGATEAEFAFDFTLSFDDWYANLFDGLKELKGVSKHITDHNLKQDYHTSSGDVELKFVFTDWSGAEADSFSFIIDHSSDTRFKRSIVFPDLGAPGTVNLATVTERELYEIMDDMERELEAFLERNFILFGDFFNGF